MKPMISIPSSLECHCPVCFEVPRPGAGPIYGCRNGHLLCQSCIEKIKKCPTCREKDIRCRNLFAEHYIETHFRDVPFKCKFDGCSMILPMTDNQLTEHEQYCPYKDVLSLASSSPEDFSSTKWFYSLFLYFLICTLICMIRNT